MLKIGDEFEESGIKVKIMEVLPFFSASGQASLMVAYKIVEGKYESPTAHFWMLKSQDVRPEIKKIVTYYTEIKTHLVGAPASAPTTPPSATPSKA